MPVSNPRALALVPLIAALCTTAALAQEPDRPAIYAVRAVTPPKIDGRLDDDVWNGPSMAGDTWTSYNPVRGERATQDTHVRVAYDASAIYFAFRCFDPQPASIRTTVSRRDDVFNDDWVAVSLDSTGTGQAAYHLFVNPSGIQMDALNSSSSGEDFAPDFRWDSAGRVDSTGYVVEMRIPLETIRFRGGDDVTMRVLFFRRNSRLGTSWSWPSIAPGKWVFESNAPLHFANLHQRRLLEAIPSTTFSRREERTGETWNGPTSAENVGASVKYGVTSTVTVEGTVNPDFSQVESDAFQLRVNQRFPIFFSEKRPFFMEGLGLLNLAGTGGDATMQTAVHTRRIVQPSSGLKLTGSAGDYSFAALSTGDKAFDDGQKVFTIGRAVRNLGKGQYAGVLVTHAEHGAEFNRVVAADVVLRHGDHFSWNAAMIGTESADAFAALRRGAGAQASYSIDTHRVTISGQAEHYGRDFQMDTAFINRVGVTRGWQYGEVQFYPSVATHGLIKRIAPFAWATRADDVVQGGPEHFAIAGVRADFIRQGHIRLDLGGGDETFARQRFTTGRHHIDGGAQFTRWLFVGGNIDRGAAVYYDPDAPFQGYNRSYGANLTVQPTARFSDRISYTYASLERSSTGDRVYGVHIVNVRATYQFTPQFLIRAIAQVDTSQRQVLGDFLASYELVPGTVVHVGYSSISEREPYGSYRPLARGFFFKASYLARL